MANTLTSLNATFKYVQDKKLRDLKPNSSIVYDMAPFDSENAVGRKYLCPVVLSYELGFTMGDNVTAFSYEDDVAGVYSEFEISPNPVVLKSRLTIEAANRMARSEKAMIDAMALRGGQMKASLLKMAEIEMLHGRTGVGTISGNPSVNTTPTPDQASIILTAASWAPGIWGGMEGAKLEVRNGATKINANGDLTLVSVDYDAKTLVVSGDNTDLTDLADGHLIFFKGAYANGQYGIKYQLDTSGSVFGIDNSTYALRKATEHTVSGALTMKAVLDGRAKAVGRAGLDEDTVLLVSSATFENLNVDLAALAAIDSRYDSKSQAAGTQGVVYHGQGGKIRVVAHPMVMEGDAFLLPEKGLKKIGSTDISFKDPVNGGEEAWRHLEGVDAFQLTGRYSFQVVVYEPGKCVYFKSITNS
jgi:hypothetical protein